MNDQHTIPFVPLLLGIAGLLPFWAIATAVFMHVPMPVQPAQLAGALAAYGAIILSFLGGVRWGLAMRTDGDRVNYVKSIIPSLVAWLLVLAPDPWRLVGLGLMAIALGPIDLELVRAGYAPLWFGRLRIVLSSGAGVALLLAAAGGR